MSNIIKFESKSDKLIKWLDNLKKDVKANNEDNIMVAIQKRNGEVLTGYFNLDVVQRQNMVANIQVHIINTMIQEKIDRYLE